MKCPAVILAGGLSSRMGGGDKCLLPLGRTSILAEIVERLSPQVDEICINSNSDPLLFGEVNLEVVPDIVPGRLGPLAGILTAMRWAQCLGASNVVTVACDTPFLPTDLVDRLLAHSNGDIAVAASGETIHPTVALWPVLHAEKLEIDLGNGARSVRRWLETMRFEIVLYASAPIDPFLNINTHGDWQRARFQIAASIPVPEIDASYSGV